MVGLRMGRRKRHEKEFLFFFSPPVGCCLVYSLAVLYGDVFGLLTAVEELWDVSGKKDWGEEGYRKLRMLNKTRDMAERQHVIGPVYGSVVFDWLLAEAEAEPGDEVMVMQRC